MSFDLLRRPSPEQEFASPYLDLPVALKDGSSAPVGELLDRYYTSVFGQYMQSMQPLRFEYNHGYQREAAQFDIGQDVCPIGHQKHVVMHAIELIEKERAAGTLLGESVTDAELANGLFAYGIHDSGESLHPDLLLLPYVDYLVGDVPAGQKTEWQRAGEVNVRRAHFDLIFDDVDPRVTAQAEEIIAHRDSTALYEIYAGAHETATLESSWRAEQAKHRINCLPGGLDIYPIDDARHTALKGMAIGVRQQTRAKAKRHSHLLHVQDWLDKTDRPITWHSPQTPIEWGYHQHCSSSAA